VSCVKVLQVLHSDGDVSCVKVLQVLHSDGDVSCVKVLQVAVLQVFSLAELLLLLLQLVVLYHLNQQQCQRHKL